jgi:hypothetical protein
MSSTQSSAHQRINIMSSTHQRINAIINTSTYQLTQHINLPVSNGDSGDRAQWTVVQWRFLSGIG